MEDLISKADAINAVRCRVQIENRIEAMTMQDAVTQIIKSIANVPPTVVRCADCKFWQENCKGTGSDLWRSCRWREDEETFPDDYCSYGERKEQ